MRYDNIGRVALPGPYSETALRAFAKQMRDEAGGLDMLRFLEVFRTTRRVRLQAVESRLKVYEAWSSLEAAVGSPLLVFAEAP